MDDAGDVVVCILFFGLIVFYYASMWEVYTKAGHPGWAVFIPIYNVYVILKIAGLSGWCLVLMLIPFVNIVIAILVVVGLAKNFGKGAGFTVGLLFLPFIFLPILAFGSAKYLE